jgi:hypothetical protein
MQQAIYNSTIRNSGRTANTVTAKRGTRLVQKIARKWDMAAVVALMGSSAVYGIFALAHLGL